eukprot:3274027-Prymnesium_polylepis.1
MHRESAKIGSGTFANPSRICEYPTQPHVKSARIRVGIPSRPPVSGCTAGSSGEDGSKSEISSHLRRGAAPLEGQYDAKTEARRVASSTKGSRERSSLDSTFLTARRQRT